MSERISKVLSNLTQLVVSPQEPGGPEPSAEPSEGDGGRRRVANGPPLAHPLRPAPLTAPHQLRLHLSAAPRWGVGGQGTERSFLPTLICLHRYHKAQTLIS